ncbi:MAG: PAS domain-containing sensor histidine kinase [Pseudomonadota bacterium]
MSVSETSPAASFMKVPRAHYRMRGGRVLGVAMALLMLGLIALVVQIDSSVTGHLSPQKTVMFVLFDLAALLVLMVYAVHHRAKLLWARAHDGMLGTRLQSRIILMFCGIAILPTIVVASFSILFFNVGIKSWFDNQVSAALEDSVIVATAYIDEHKDAIRTDAIGMSDAVKTSGTLMLSNPAAFSDFLSEQSAERHLSEAIVFDRQRVLARTALSFSLSFERLPEQVLSRADAEQVAIFGDDQNKIQAVVKISHLPDMYLMVARVVDPKVLDHMQAARETVTEYHQLQRDLAILQKQFFVVFVLIALLVLLASLWAGMLLAVRLIEPLRALMAATEHVRGGDYSIRVPEGRTDDEIANLGRTFNRMIGQLETQRRDLIDANRLADERRRFTEAVLLGVSAGIIALDGARKVTLHNRTALELLGREDAIIREPIAAVLPDVEALVMQAEKKPDRIASGDVILQQNEKRITLHVQVTAEQFGNAIEGYIVTFDDVTELVAAQRSAAWADVARRIAHEIKNPLTPITLSAERLRKKFGPEAGSEERESFDRYLDTIARHTRDIGRMVEEFVAYARLPASVFRAENLVSIIRKTVFSAQTAHADIHYTQTLPATAVTLLCDEAQLGQALLNLLKNAAEAMEGQAEKTVAITLSETASAITLTLADNGPGFPADKIAQLMEPYVTTRAKGTGLGLAIVKRSIEEHKGSITLANGPQGGAVVTMVFPVV